MITLAHGIDQLRIDDAESGNYEIMI